MVASGLCWSTVDLQERTDVEQSEHVSCALWCVVVKYNLQLSFLF